MSGSVSFAGGGGGGGRGGGGGGGGGRGGGGVGGRGRPPKGRPMSQSQSNRRGSSQSVESLDSIGVQSDASDLNSTFADHSLVGAMLTILLS
jgi:hypothetical protein